MNELFRPHPHPSADSLPYWQGLKAHRLCLQRCASCGRVRHYPQALCPRCLSFDVEWITASGEAEACSWTTLHHAFDPVFKPLLPCTLVTATLREGVRLLAPFKGDAALLVPGMPLRVGFETISAELTLPMLLPA